MGLNFVEAHRVISFTTKAKCIGHHCIGLAITFAYYIFSRPFVIDLTHPLFVSSHFLKSWFTSIQRYRHDLCLVGTPRSILYIWGWRAFSLHFLWNRKERKHFKQRLTLEDIQSSPSMKQKRSQALQVTLNSVGHSIFTSSETENISSNPSHAENWSALELHLLWNRKAVECIRATPPLKQKISHTIQVTLKSGGHSIFA